MRGDPPTDASVGKGRSRRALGRVAPALLSVAAVLLTLVLVEGCASLFLLGHDLASGGAAERTSRVYMQPDSLLGWRTVPNLRMPEMFGPGVGLNTNSQALRGLAEYDSVPPPGRIRVLCSGDSFTFGYGVADGENWCAQLEARDPRLQAVNLGNSGYGIDQTYLRYLHEAPGLEHTVHIFALIPDDLRRMRLSEFIARPKPYFRLEEGNPVLHNVPVPTPSPIADWQQRHERTLGGVRILELGRRLSRRLFGSRPAAGYALDEREAEQVMLRLFDDLQRTSEERGIELAVVLLDGDLPASGSERRLQQLLEVELPRRGIRFIDLWSRLRSLPAERLESLFDPRWNHYTAGAHRIVADEIYDELSAWPRLRAVLALRE